MASQIGHSRVQLADELAASETAVQVAVNRSRASFDEQRLLAIGPKQTTNQSATSATLLRVSRGSRLGRAGRGM